MNVARIFVFCLCLFFLSCKKELIDRLAFQKPKTKYELVIEGGVNSLAAEQFIKITKPAYAISDSIIPINNAEVFINDIPLKLTQVAGVYSTVLLDNKCYNQPYHLKIIYNGLTYNATDTLKKVASITFSELNFSTQKENKKILVSIPKHIFNAAKAAKLFYQLPGNGAWSPSSFDASPYYSFIHFYAPPYGLSPILEERTEYAFNPTDTIGIYKFSVSALYEKYLYSVFQETDWKSLFSSTPGQIKGNVSGNALGYFSCSDVTSQKSEIKTLVK